MAIASAQQDGNKVKVYDEKGKELFKKDGALIGFTNATVTVKWNGKNITYDEKGREKFRK
jgi:hypothetical protein